MTTLDNGAIEVLASGLGYPEGPVHCSDGSILFVELKSQCLSRLPVGGGLPEKVVDVPGSPNGLAAGPDGDLYIANSGGFSWIPIVLPSTQALWIGGDQPPNYAGGKLQRFNPKTSAVTDLYTSCDKKSGWPAMGAWKPPFPLRGPDDLVVDAQGGVWFSDFGKQRPTDKDVTGIYYAAADGSRITQMAYPVNSSNGIALSKDGSKLFVALTYERRIIYFELSGPGKIDYNKANVTDGSYLLTADLPGQAMPDSIAVDSDDNVYVATMLPDGANPMSNGGISVVSPKGGVEFVEIKMPDGSFSPMPSNICFGGPDLKTAYITCGASGTLISMPSAIAGLPLNFDGSQYDFGGQS
ncbi:MAG: SMP-30/gluconolactonase/LRE family protein [Pseudomonadota bacterium]